MRRADPSKVALNPPRLSGRLRADLEWRGLLYALWMFVCFTWIVVVALAALR